MAINLNYKINQLLRSLDNKGAVVLLTTKQLYSEEFNKRYTRYTVQVKAPAHLEAKEEFKQKIYLLNYLVSLHKSITGGDG